LSRVGRCDHAVKLIDAICTAGRPTYSHHYGYSVHAKAAACIPRSSGFVFVAARRFPSLGWYDIDSRLDYSCPAALPPAVGHLANLTGECKRYPWRVQHIQTEVLGEPTEGPLAWRQSLHRRETT